MPERTQRLDVREPGTQPRDEFRYLVEIAFKDGAGGDGLDGGLAAPQIGAAQGANAGHFHIDSCVSL